MDIHRSKCGRLGKGTPGSRLKAAWKRSDLKYETLRVFVLVAADNPEHPMCNDAREWLESK